MLLRRLLRRSVVKALPPSAVPELGCCAPSQGAAGGSGRLAGHSQGGKAGPSREHSHLPWVLEPVVSKSRRLHCLLAVQATTRSTPTTATASVATPEAKGSAVASAALHRSPRAPPAPRRRRRRCNYPAPPRRPAPRLVCSSSRGWTRPFSSPSAPNCLSIVTSPARRRPPRSSRRAGGTPTQAPPSPAAPRGPKLAGHQGVTCMAAVRSRAAARPAAARGWCATRYPRAAQRARRACTWRSTGRRSRQT